MAFPPIAEGITALVHDEEACNNRYRSIPPAMSVVHMARTLVSAPFSTRFELREILRVLRQIPNICQAAGAWLYKRPIAD
jgi:hypothetical protein